AVHREVLHVDLLAHGREVAGEVLAGADVGCGHRDGSFGEVMGILRSGAMSTRTSTSGWPVVGTSAPSRCREARPWTVAHTTPANSAAGRSRRRPAACASGDTG